MAYKYTFQSYDDKKMARAVGVSLPISYKQASDICTHIKNRSVKSAKQILDNVVAHKQAMPYRRFNRNVAHKAGMAGGRYPRNASKEIYMLIESVEANATNKGLTKDLYITHMNAHRAPASPAGGRIPGEAKRAHVEIIVEEKVVTKKKYEGKKK